MNNNDDEIRQSLCRRKAVFTTRISEIRKTLGVKKGVQFYEIKGPAKHKPEYKEWCDLAKRMHKIDAEINSIPKSKQSLEHKIFVHLKYNLPEIYEQCIEAIKDQS